MRRPRSKEGGDLPTVMRPGRSTAGLQAHAGPASLWITVTLGSWSKNCREGPCSWSLMLRRRYLECVWGALDDLQGAPHSGPQSNLGPWDHVKSYLLESQVKTHAYNFWPAGEMLSPLPSHPSNVSFGKETVYGCIIFLIQEWGFFFLFLPSLSLLRCKETQSNFSSSMSSSLVALLKFQSPYNPGAFCHICVPPVSLYN